MENYLGPSTLEKIRQASQEKEVEAWEKNFISWNIAEGLDSPKVYKIEFYPRNYGEWAREVGPGGEMYKVEGEATPGEYAWGDELKAYKWSGVAWEFVGQKGWPAATFIPGLSGSLPPCEWPVSR